MIHNRLVTLSCNQSTFSKALPPYNNALKKSGYSEIKPESFNHSKPNREPGKKQRKRKITWFNPPYNEEVKTNIGKEFFRLIDKHFPPHHKLHKICNRTNIKLSYSCMPNIASIISGHNQKVLSESTATPEPTQSCNCRRKNECPLDGNCKIKSIVYRATVTPQNHTQRYYIGSCETDFKTRYNNHKQTFKFSTKRNETELSKEIWRLKDNQINFQLTWAVADRAPSYTCGGKNVNSASPKNWPF